MSYQSDTMPYAHDPSNAEQENKLRVPDGYTLIGVSLRATEVPTAGTFEVERLLDGEASGAGDNQLDSASFDLTDLVADEETFIDYTGLASSAVREYATKAWLLGRAVNLAFADDSDALEVSGVFQKT